MAKNRQSRPAGGRPTGQRGKAGVGPGPAYRPSSSGGGTRHKNSASAVAPQLALVFGIFLVLPAITGLTVLAYLLHGYGVL
jgi:hypothetical protein